jgi:endonuclease/exonuclease/phosphatase family metal-dependent hydrolase
MMSESILEKYGDNLRVLVAGDFNTSEDDYSYVSEATLRSFYGAHYRSCFSGIKKDRRITCPGNGRYEDATFDYVLYKGFGKRKDIKIFNGLGISDHNPVALSLSLE